MSDTQMNYLARFSLDTSDLTKGITGAAIAFDAITLASKEAFAIMKQGYDVTIGAATRLANELDNLSDVTGVSTEDIQRLKAAGLAVGSDFSNVSQTMRIFSQRVADTGTSGETLRAKLAEIGVQVTDSNGKYRSATDLYMEINAQLGRMPEVLERNTLASQIYGKSWSTVADMIDKAGRSSAAFKNADVISKADIDKANEYSIKLGIISDKLGIMGSKVGIGVIDAVGNNPLLTGDLTGSALGNLLGINNQKNKGGADREDGVLNLKQQTAAIEPLINKYEGLTGVGLQYAEAANSVQDAQLAVAKALSSGSQSAYDTANLNLARTTEAFQKLRKEMSKTTQEATGTTQEVSTGGDMNLVGTSLGGYGGKYSQAQDIMGGSYDQGNYYGRQLAALAARARSASGGLGGGDSWMNTGSNESIANQALSLKSQYDKSTNIYVNVPEGTPADMADRVAAAISRALAQQVAL